MQNGFSWQNATRAEAETDGFIATSINWAVYWQLRADHDIGDCGGCHDASLRELANAEHAGQESTSPEHSGYQPWFGYELFSGILHKYREWHSALGLSASDESAQAEARYETDMIATRFANALAGARKKERRPGAS